MQSLDERARWLARHIVPQEAALRQWLARRPVAGLEIDDIIQETYSRLSLLPSVDDILSPKNYMFSAAHSVILSHLRRARIVPMHSYSHLDYEAFVDDVPSAETIAIDRDELSRLGEAIAALPHRMREVFILRRIEGLSQREVAEQMGLAQSTVEKHMASGFRRLADHFGRGGKHSARASTQDKALNERDNGARDRQGH